MVSSAKSNSVFKKSPIQHYTLDLVGSSPVEGFARTIIELPGDPFPFSLSHFKHIHTLGQILP